MTNVQATAEVFFRAIKSLPKAQRDEVLSRIAKDKSLREDLFDLATFAARRHEPSRPLSEYLAERRAR